MTESRSVNDPSISDEADLWRRISPEWIILDENLGRQRVTSKAFQNLEGDNLSVLLEQIVRETGRTADDVLKNLSGYSLAAVTAGQARALGQGVVRAPEPDEPAHCHMVGKKGKGARKKLASAARWVIPPHASQS